MSRKERRGVRERVKKGRKERGRKGEEEYLKKKKKKVETDTRRQFPLL